MAAFGSFAGLATAGVGALCGYEEEALNCINSKQSSCCSIFSSKAAAAGRSSESGPAAAGGPQHPAPARTKMSTWQAASNMMMDGSISSFSLSHDFLESFYFF